MLFNQEGLDLQCLFFLFFRLLLFWIISLSGVAYKSVAYKKACNNVLCSSKEIILLHGSMSLFLCLSLISFRLNIIAKIISKVGGGG